jgi:hypothetical protein
MPKFNIQPLEDPLLSSIVFQWNLEFPTAGEPFNSENASSLSLRGWAVATGENQPNLHLVVRFRDRTLSCPLNQDRNDVVKHFFEEHPQGQKHIRCGFEYPLNPVDVETGFEIAFEIDGFIRKAARVSMVPHQPE